MLQNRKRGDFPCHCRNTTLLLFRKRLLLIWRTTKCQKILLKEASGHWRTFESGSMTITKEIQTICVLMMCCLQLAQRCCSISGCVSTSMRHAFVPVSYTLRKQCIHCCAESSEIWELTTLLPTSLTSMKLIFFDFTRTLDNLFESLRSIGVGTLTNSTEELPREDKEQVVAFRCVRSWFTKRSPLRCIFFIVAKAFACMVVWSTGILNGRSLNIIMGQTSMFNTLPKQARWPKSNATWS